MNFFYISHVCFMLNFNGKSILVYWRLITIKLFGSVCKYQYKIVQTWAGFFHLQYFVKKVTLPKKKFGVEILKSSCLHGWILVWKLICNIRTFNNKTNISKVGFITNKQIFCRLGFLLVSVSACWRNVLEIKNEKLLTLAYD